MHSIEAVQKKKIQCFIDMETFNDILCYNKYNGSPKCKIVDCVSLNAFI